MKSKILKLLNKGLFVSLLVLICVFSTHFFSQAGDKKNKETITDFKQLRKRQIEFLVKKLSDKKNWKDKKRNEEIIKYLETARVLNAYELAPILSQYISFINKKAALEMISPLRAGPMFPVYKTMKSFGLYSVPFLMQTIKKSDIKKNSNEFYYSLICIIAIYDEGGFGKELAKKRLELELKKTKDKKERANLEAALSHKTFKTKDIEPD